MIYTSYFANWRKWEKIGTPISIARSTPINFKGFLYTKIAPSFELLSDWKHGIITKETYIKRYFAELNKLDKEEVLNELNKIAHGSDIVLLCYEKKENFCHRHLVAEWLGIEIKEI